MYFYPALFAVLLYPFAWYFLVSPVVMFVIYNTAFLAVYISAAMALASAGSLHYMRKIASGIESSFRYAVVWFFGPMISGLLCSFALYGVLLMQEGYAVEVDYRWFLAMQMPGTLATLVAYVLTSVLVTPVHAASA
jgi:hypothetical protein